MKLIPAIFLLAATAASLPSVAQVSTSPVAPRAQETVRAVAPQVFNDATSANQGTYNIVDAQGTLVTMAGNKVTVSLLMGKSDFPSAPSAKVDIPIGQFPAGNYELLITRREPNGAPFGDVGSTVFPVSSRGASDPLWNHTDLWWDPAESGWGLNIVQHGSTKIFATWFVYGADNRATWFVVPDGTWVSPKDYRGTIYRTTGPDYAACTRSSCPVRFDPTTVTRVPVGELSLNFHGSSAGSAAALITIDGKTISKLLQRQSF